MDNGVRKINAIEEQTEATWTLAAMVSSLICIIWSGMKEFVELENMPPLEEFLTQGRYLQLQHKTNFLNQRHSSMTLLTSSAVLLQELSTHTEDELLQTRTRDLRSKLLSYLELEEGLEKVLPQFAGDEIPNQPTTETESKEGDNAR